MGPLAPKARIILTRSHLLIRHNMPALHRLTELIVRWGGGGPRPRYFLEPIDYNLQGGLEQPWPGECVSIPISSSCRLRCVSGICISDRNR